ncbi:hypothetical protein ACIBG0_17120 [Nocardia sp. NPDC050630]|uniref:hypothetical protein n=1 Tax=Nocardia TaxID=1817 RepID=UPI0007A52C89|nr:hypothetical protein [Nocardia anaemiae]
MKFGTFAVTLVSIAAVGIAAGTANAKPAEVAKEVSASGVEQGIGYHTVASEISDGHRDRVLTTEVDSGKFELADNGTKVLLKSDSGDVVSEVPLTYELSGTKVAVDQTISENGRTLALTPKLTAKNIGEMQPVNSMARLTDEINKNIVGVVLGGVLGLIIGAIVGVFFFSLITGPIGAVIGAIAGGYIMGGQSFMDALMAVINGEP